MRARTTAKFVRITKDTPRELMLFFLRRPFASEKLGRLSRSPSRWRTTSVARSGPLLPQT